MSASLPPRMTARAFIAWAVDRPDGERYELVAGEVVAMPPERVAHALTKFSVAHAMADAVRKARLKCTVYPDGMAVAIDDETVYEPDALLRCGPELDGGALAVPDPIVVVEVRSALTGARDSGAKLADYFRIPSLRHYLVVLERARTVIHHVRDDTGRIATVILRDAPVPLDPPGLVLLDYWPRTTGPGRPDAI